MPRLPSLAGMSEAGEDKGQGRQLGSNVKYAGTGTTPRGERNTRI